jgi:arylformamidase
MWLSKHLINFYFEVTLTEIIKQVQVGIGRVLADADGSEVYICGHSAGAHLAAMMLHAKFSSEAAKNLKGLFLVSGVFDLTPILKTDINDNLHMNVEEAVQCSPLLKTEISSNREGIKVLLVYGENESNSFKDQSFAYLNVS